MPTYSNSRLGTYEQCPLKYKFSYIDELETEFENTVEAFLGSMVHQALEKLHKDAKFEKVLEKEELLDFYNNEWQKSWDEKIIIVREEYSRENYRQMGERYLSDYHKRYYPFNQTRTIGLETQDTVELTEGYRIHVRMDRLSVNDNTYEIHDYKTSSRLPKQEDLDEDRQLAIYAYGVKKMYPDAENIRLVWHFLAFDKEMVSYRTEEQLADLRTEIMELITKIESCTEFKPSESALCDWCEFQPQCPRFKHLFKIEELEETQYLKDSGVELVNKYSQAIAEKNQKEEEAEKLKEAIVAYCKREGIQVVYGTSQKASISSYPRLSFPKKFDDDRDDFVETIKKLGLSEQLSTVDTYELAKMINNRDLPDELVKLLGRFIKRDENTTIRLSKR
ncbi:MAG: PD-(D/E)XK nuclease family protein [Candidatus Woesearchaeota archaeon]